MPFVCLFEVFGRLSVFPISFGFALESIYYFICPISAEKKAILQTILYMHQLLLSNLIQANRKEPFWKSMSPAFFKVWCCWGPDLWSNFWGMSAT